MSTPTGSPDFFLSSSDDLFWSTPRAAWVEQRLEAGRLEVRVDPPVVGQPFGRGDDLERLVLAPRFAGDDLHAPAAFPIHVHVLVPLDGETRHAAWGELVESRAEAERIAERARAADRASA